MFTLEKTSNEVESWMIKQIFKVEPEPGQSDGSGSSQKPRLRNPDINLHVETLFKFFYNTSYL